MSVEIIEGDLTPNDGKYAIVVGRWNAFVVESLLEGAVDSLTRHGVEPENITVVRCPGAMEIPLVAQKVAQSGKYDAIITLGAVIRGGTPHFEYVSSECTKGLGQVAMQFGPSLGTVNVRPKASPSARLMTKSNPNTRITASSTDLISPLTP